MSTQHYDEEFKKAPSKQSNKTKGEKNKIANNQTLLKIGEKHMIFDKDRLGNQDNGSRHLKQKVEEVEKLLNLETAEQDRVLKQIVEIYESVPFIFHQSIMNQKAIQKSNIPLLFLFIKRIVSYYDIFPFEKREKTSKFFEDLSSFVNQRKQISQEELLFLLQINEEIWKQSKNKQLDGIIKISIQYFLQISIILCKREIIQQELMILERMIKSNFKGIISALERNQQCQYLKIQMFTYLEGIFRLLDSTKNNFDCLPLFDLAVLSLTSVHHQKFYQDMVTMIFDFLKIRLQEKKDEKCDSQEQSLEEYEKTLRILLTISKILNFNSIFQASKNDLLQQKVVYSQQKILLVLFNHKKNILKLLEQLQKIGKGNIPDKTITELFEMAAFCHRFDNKLCFQRNVVSILTKQKLRDHFKVEGISEVSSEMILKEQLKEQLGPLKQKIFFEILYKVEKLLSFYDFELYLDQYINNPIFKRQISIANMFNNSPDDVLLKFMVNFTQRWLLEDMRNFDFNHYLIIFLDKCIRTDNFRLFGAYIKRLEVTYLLKINEIIFRISFDEDKRKFGIPESSDENVQLAYLTSAGFIQKYALVNKIFPTFSEQLVWKQIIRSLFSAQNYNYIYVKAFYNVLNIELNFAEQNYEKLNKILEEFDYSIINENLQYICSIFHLLCCIGFKSTQTGSQPHQLKTSFQTKLLDILLSKSREIIKIPERIFDIRRCAYKSLSQVSSQLSINNVNFAQRLKRFHFFFNKSIIRWMERVQNVQNIINHRRQFEEVLEIEKLFGKHIQFRSLHLERTLSHFCSQNYFDHYLEKIKKKVNGKVFIFTNQFMYLREIMLKFVNKYPEEDIHGEYCLTEEDSIEYFLFLLNQKVQSTKQREQLKQKLLVLDSLHQIIDFFMKNGTHELVERFNRKYYDSLKLIVVEIALHNPDLIGKYQKQLILHIRVSAIKLIMKLYHSEYEILGGQNIFGFVLQLCVDKSVQIRLLILNLMSSRFKNDDFKAFLENKYRVASFLTIFSIFEPTIILQKISRRMLETIKKNSDQNSSFGFIVLIYSLKMIFNDIQKALLNKEDQYMYLDTFIRNFDEIWLIKREWQYVTYYFIHMFLQDKRMVFILDKLDYNRYGTTRRFISRQKQDLMLQVQIKQRFKQIDFEFPPDQVPDTDNINIKVTMEEIPFRIFSKLKLILMEKSRGVRILKGKKDFLIHWKVLEKEGLISFDKQKELFSS